MAACMVHLKNVTERDTKQLQKDSLSVLLLCWKGGGPFTWLCQGAYFLIICPWMWSSHIAFTYLTAYWKWEQQRDDYKNVMMELALPFYIQGSDSPLFPH